MPPYLLTWNPRKWRWDDFDSELMELERFGAIQGTWSCGNTKRIIPGDRVFLLRQGQEPRGLIASGWALSTPYSDQHWADKGALGRRTRYIEVEWDALAREPIISRNELNDERFAGVNWNTQTSGIRITPSTARALDLEWGLRVGSHFEFLPEEILDADFPTEGSTSRF